MWPVWAGAFYIQVKLYALFINGNIRLPFIDSDFYIEVPFKTSFCHQILLKVQCTLMMKFNIMKRMFKWWWSTIHRYQQNEQSPLTSRKTRTSDLGNPGPGSGQAFWLFFLIFFCIEKILLSLNDFHPHTHQ